MSSALKEEEGRWNRNISYKFRPPLTERAQKTNKGQGKAQEWCWNAQMEVISFERKRDKTDIGNANLAGPERSNAEGAGGLSKQHLLTLRPQARKK